MTSKLPLALAMAALGLLASILPVSAQTTVTTDPVGFMTTSLLGQSDTYVALPFTRPAEFVGTVASTSSNAILVTGTQSWTANQFVYLSGTAQFSTYYVQIGTSASTNPNEGRIYKITGNDTTGTLSINLNGDSISSIAAGTPISVIPYWTFNTVFPASNANVSFTPSTSTFAIQTKILIPDYTSSGVNLAPSQSYYFIKSGTNVGWRSSQDATTVDHGNDILNPLGYIIARNSASAPTLPLTVTGSVLTKKLTLPLATQTSTKQDNFVSIQRPVDVTLNNLGLSGTNGTFTPTATTFVMKDQLFLYDNTTLAYNKSPAKVYYYISSGTNVGWRITTSPTTEDHGSDLIPAGSAIVVRKATTAAGTTTFWTNSATY